MKRGLALAGLVMVLAVPGLTTGRPQGAGAGAPSADPGRARQIVRGRNIVVAQGCNECHTAGYSRRGGDVPESDWLSGGDPEGLRGPWGVSYAPDLRAVVSGLSDTQWVTLARELKKRPPMPQHNLSDMSDADLKALYWFIKSLGPTSRGVRRPPQDFGDGSRPPAPRP